MTSFPLHSGPKKEELTELRDQLDSTDADDRKAAAKKVVNLMRLGENVGVVFTSMLRCVKTSDIELKRLVYVYLLNYSLQESEQSIMAVNCFVQDSEDENPLIRALAIRTMSRIRIDSVAENFIVPIKNRLSDTNAYVRKTVALAIAKLYSTIPESVENSGLLESLLGLLRDENPLVVSNATAAICEINEGRESPVFRFKKKDINPIVNAVSNSSEWCQCILFDALAKHEPECPEDAAILIERILPFLKHKNPSVVIGAFKCILAFMDFDTRVPQDVFPTVLPPFLTLVSSGDREIQFVVLRTLGLFMQKYPRSLARDIRIFFCKYNDPAYVKMEKLSIITANVTASNAGLVLDEMAEYCNSVDVSFVRKTVKSIGEIALKLDICAKRCVDILVTLVEGKAEYATEQAIIVLADILRKYPGSFESVIAKICQNVEHLKDPSARAALIWILGEYCALIEQVDLILDPFLDTFHDEQAIVQLQLISSIVKVYLDRPDDANDMLQYVLNEATKDTVLPDVRNKALIYWRMLSMGPEVTKELVQFKKEGVEPSGINLAPDVVQELMANIGFTSGVLYVLPSKFVRKAARVESIEDSEIGREWKPVYTVNDTGAIALYSDWSSKNYFLQILNKSETPISGFMLAVNTNGSGFGIEKSIEFPDVLPPGEMCDIAIGYMFNPTHANPQSSASVLEVALKTSAGIQYFRERINARKIVCPSNPMKKHEFLSFYKAHGAAETCIFDIDNAVIASKQELKQRQIHVVAAKENETCVSLALGPNKRFICDLEARGTAIHVCMKGDRAMFPLLMETAKYLFCNE